MRAPTSTLVEVVRSLHRFRHRSGGHTGRSSPPVGGARRDARGL